MVQTVISELPHECGVVVEPLIVVSVLERGRDGVGERPREVVLCRKVEALGREDLLEEADRSLLSASYLVLGRILEAQRHELEFGGEVHVAVCDVGGELCFCDDHQVVLHLQLDQSVDREGQVRGLVQRGWVTAGLLPIGPPFLTISMLFPLFDLSHSPLTC